MDPATCPNPSGAAASLLMAGISVLSSLQCGIGDPSIYPDDETSPRSKYDFIVVGAGAAGCVLANRLSANRHWKVLLLEAGENPPFTSEIPLLYSALLNSDFDWKYQTKGNGKYCLGMVDNKCSWTQGRVLGGGTVLSALIYSRGHPKDYSAWVEKGNKNWDYEDLIPFFEKAEGIKIVKDEGHLHLEPFEGRLTNGELPLLKPLERAVGKAGHPATLEPRIVTQLGIFNSYATIRDGARYSSAKAYLAPIKNRRNLHVVKNAFVTKIILKNKRRAIGVIYEKDGVNVTVTAKKEVILSAGAIGSPKLLMLSGIGPKKHLRKLGIAVVADLPVGRNLQNKLQFPGVVASIDRGASSTNPATQLARHVAEYLLDKKGPLSGVGYFQFPVFVNTKNSKDTSYPDVEIQFEHFMQGENDTLSQILSAIGYNRKVSSEYLRLVNEAGILVVKTSIIYPKSSGKLQLISTNPHDHPTIDPNYLGDPADEHTMLRGIKESMRILKVLSHEKGLKVEPRAVLKQCLEEGKKRGSASKSKDIDDSYIMTEGYWRCAVRKLSVPHYNTIGTCRMGQKRSDSVVDRHLKVHSVKGLRVIDSSVMPRHTSGGTIGPVTAIAERGASTIIHEYKKKS